MSFELVDFKKEKTRKKYSSTKSNSVSMSKSSTNRPQNLSPIYTNYGSPAANNKDANHGGFFYTVVSIVKSIFSFLYLLVTDFSIRRVMDMFSAIFDFIFLKPIRAIRRSKFLMVLFTGIFLIMCMGFVMEKDAN